MGDVKSAAAEGRALFDKLVKETETETEVVDGAATGGNDSDSELIVTEGFLRNYQKDEHKELVLLDEHHWSGGFVENSRFPPTLKWYESTSVPHFKHSARKPESSVAGVVYGNGRDSIARQWLIAFDTLNRKAYAEAGPIGKVDWNVVKVKLDQSGPRCEYLDPILGGLVYSVFSDREWGHKIHGLFYH